MACRPKRDDTEEDLLEFQQQFLSNKNNPSASVVRASKDGHGNDSAGQRDIVDLQGLPQSLVSSTSGDFGPPKKKSKFKSKRMSNANIKQTKNSLDEDAAEMLEKHDRHITSVLSEIRERETQQYHVVLPTKSLVRGFPEAVHRGNTDKIHLNGSNSNSKTSLFSQHFKSSNPSLFGLPQQSQTTYKNNIKTTKTETYKEGSFSVSSLVSGEGLISSSHKEQDSFASKEAERIHTENIERLSALSQEEILQEKDRLMKHLDPSLLSFLKSKQNPKHEDIGSSRESTMETEDDLENKALSCSIVNSNKQSVSSDIEMKVKHVQFDDNVEIKEELISMDNLDEADKLSKMATEQKWVNMGNIEPEKLEWMKDCPPPSAIKKQGEIQARFAFDGSLITRESDIPVNIGLHHHGDEPEAAGYTLKELFVLSRSSFLQQRVLALQTLGRIIVQDTQGAFTDHLCCSVMSTLMDSGIMFLLRWALDDTADAMIAVAIQCLFSTLIVPSDQDWCDVVFDMHRGQEVPSLRPQELNESEQEERKNETDAEMVQRDAIKGLIQMRILPRLRYILEVCRPSATTVRAIFSILTRIASHSTEASYAITKCPRMMESIMKFLPSTWRKIAGCLGDETDIYGLPSPEALLLLRTMCTSGRNIASFLISKYRLIGHLLCYISLQPHDMQLAFPDAMKLCTESLRIWSLCTCYGLGCDQFRETFPSLLQNVQKLQDLSIIKSTNHTNVEYECQRACSYFKLLDQIIHVAGTSAEMHAKMIAASPNPKRDAEADCLSPPPINWTHVMGFIPVVMLAFVKWKNEIVNLDEQNVNNVLDCHVLRCAGMCNLIASFYSKLPLQPSFSPVDSLQEIENLVSTVIIPIINSAFFTSVISNLRNCSHNPLFTRGVPNLPDYGTLPAHMGFRTSQPGLPFPNSPSVAFLTAFNYLLCSIINCHKGIATKLLSLVTRNDVIHYVQRVSSMQEVLSQSYFGRFELIMQYFMIKLFYLVVRSDDSNDLSSLFSVYHSAALAVFFRLRTGDEYYAHDLMSVILFNPDFYPEVHEQETKSIERDLSILTIASQGISSQLSATRDRRPYTEKDLICEAHKNLLAIRSTYMSAFGMMRHALATSRSHALCQPQDIQSLQLSSSRAPFLPADWMFLPIIDLHNQTINTEGKGGFVDEVSPAMISTVTCTLQMILMLEEWRPSALSGVTMVAKITRLMCIFLTGNDLFLDRHVHHYVTSLLLIYTRQSNLSRLDFSGNVAGLTSFYDLYTSLLTQYSAVSFGDSLFASFLVLPLAQRHDVKFRHALWDEFVGTLRAVSFPVKQAPIPLDNYLYPIEQDHVLIYLYLRALANQDVRPRWCPFFYVIAIHHVNAYIYQLIDPKDILLLKRKLSLIDHVMQVKLEDVKNDILYYYKPVPDSSSDKAFEVFTSLPPDREMLLRNRNDIEECRKLYEKML